MLPVENLKSRLVSMAFQTWCLGLNPSAQILCVSCGQELADKLSRDCLRVSSSTWCRARHRERATELSDYSVCTNCGIAGKNLYLIDVLRQRLEYPELKRAVRAQYERFRPSVVLIGDKASGTQLIQELIAEGLRNSTRSCPCTRTPR